MGIRGCGHRVIVKMLGVVLQCKVWRVVRELSGRKVDGWYNKWREEEYSGGEEYEDDMPPIKLVIKIVLE